MYTTYNPMLSHALRISPLLAPRKLASFRKPTYPEPKGPLMGRRCQKLQFLCKVAHDNLPKPPVFPASPSDSLHSSIASSNEGILKCDIHRQLPADSCRAHSDRCYSSRAGIREPGKQLPQPAPATPPHSQNHILSVGSVLKNLSNNSATFLRPLSLGCVPSSARSSGFQTRSSIFRPFSLSAHR